MKLKLLEDACFQTADKRLLHVYLLKQPENSFQSISVRMKQLLVSGTKLLLDLLWKLSVMFGIWCFRVSEPDEPNFRPIKLDPNLFHSEKLWTTATFFSIKTNESELFVADSLLSLTSDTLKTFSADFWCFDRLMWHRCCDVTSVRPADLMWTLIVSVWRKRTASANRSHRAVVWQLGHDLW